MLTLERAEELLATTTTQEHLFLHAKNVMAAICIEAMKAHAEELQIGPKV